MHAGLSRRAGNDPLTIGMSFHARRDTVDGIKAPVNEIVWRKLQADLATWSSRGRLQILPESNHAFFFFKPDVVATAIEEVLAAARVVRRPSATAG